MRRGTEHRRNSGWCRCSVRRCHPAEAACEAAEVDIRGKTFQGATFQGAKSVLLRLDIPAEEESLGNFAGCRDWGKMD